MECIMKTYKERTNSILQKADKTHRQQIKKIAKVSGMGLGATALALVLFLPYPTSLPSVTAYKDSPYYEVIQTLNELAYEPPMYKNNFEKWTSGLRNFGMVGSGGLAAPLLPPSNGNDWAENATPPTGGSSNTQGTTSIGGGNSNGNYVENTDNQVAGVTEGDLLKRTEKYAFYLTPKQYRPREEVWNGMYYEYQQDDGHLLRIYEINGNDSKQVGEFEIVSEGVWQVNVPEMYLSEDGNRLTIFNRVAKESYKKQYTEVVSLDVGDVTNVKENARIYLSGSYVSSRLVKGEFLLVNNMTVYSSQNQIDFDDETVYLPQYGDSLEGLETVSAEDIICPQNPEDARYTVVTKFNENTLEISATKALLSYSNEVTVSETNLFLTQKYTQTESPSLTLKEDKIMTEISCISYQGEGLEFMGNVTVEGEVRNQYSLDEYQNMLRVATTTSVARRPVYENGDTLWTTPTTNANLYCIDLTTFQIAGKVEGFAPENEEVRSVRFDGVKAYVCTAEVVRFKDPVFAFDLTDVTNITYTDTGTIDGYSSSLIAFGDGYLIGIGYGSMRGLKVEVYVEGEDKVESVGAYELNASFSEDYKSYYIDRKNGFIGLGVTTYKGEECYLLLQWKNGEFAQIITIPHEGQNPIKRAFYEEGYLYLFGEEFKVVGVNAGDVA